MCVCWGVDWGGGCSVTLCNLNSPDLVLETKVAGQLLGYIITVLLICSVCAIEVLEAQIFTPKILTIRFHSEWRECVRQPFSATCSRLRL